MTDGAARLSGIAWGHFRRWFVRGRVFRLAVQVRSLTLATLGVLLTIFGWWLIAQPFRASDEGKIRTAPYVTCPWKSDAGASHLENFARGTNRPDIGGPPLAPWRRLSAPAGGPDMGSPPSDPVVDPWRRLSTPAFEFLEYTQTFVGAAFLSLCILWAALVWGLFGGAITRAALVQLTREEPVSLGASLRFAGRRWLSYFSAPIFPLLGICVVGGGLMLLGLLMKVSYFFGGLFWPLALVAGVIMAVLALGLMVGWPLMHAAISAEGSDSFDALSRSYSYVYQRPMHYLLYVVSAVLLGGLGIIVANLFAGTVEGLTAWGVSWGSGVEHADRAINGDADLLKPGTLDRWGIGLIDFWQGIVRAIVIGFAFSYFWTAAAAAYLLLRHDADGAELDEVYVDDDAETLPLPDLAAAAPAKPTPAVEPADIPSQPE